VTKHFEVIIYQPLQVLALRAHGPREAVAGLRVVSRRVGVVAVVGVVGVGCGFVVGLWI